MGYDVTAVIEGYYDEPTVTLSSSPPLPDEELLLMVLTGTPPASGGVSGDAMYGTGMAIFLGRSFLGRLFGGGEETGVDIADRFELEIGRGVTEKGEPTIDTQFLMFDEVLWRNGDLYLTSEKDIYDDYDAGVKFVVKFR